MSRRRTMRGRAKQDDRRKMICPACCQRVKVREVINGLCRNCHLAEAGIEPGGDAGR